MMKENGKINYIKYKNFEQKYYIFKIVLLCKIYIEYFFLYNVIKKKEQSKKFGEK